MLRLAPLLLVALAACAPVPPPAPAAPPVVGGEAWVTFDARRDTGGGASGVADPGTGRALTPDDPVRVASVSKLVVALVVMRLVEQGVLDLDADVSDHLGWRLRNPTFPDTPITLRLLLSHRSSLTDRADYLIPLGGTLREWVARPGAFDTAHAPGTYFRYANLNSPVIASVIERATGERFDRAIHRLALAPLGLDACFGWTMCSDTAIARAVMLARPDGSVATDDLRGKRPACPVIVAPGIACDLASYVPGTNGALFSPQGGLRISARGLAVVGRVLLNGGRHGDTRFLSDASIAAILTPVWRYDGTNGETDDGFNCAYGLAAHSVPTGRAGCRDDLFGDGRAVVGHAGEAYSLRSGLWVDRARGVGIAYFATANAIDPPAGRSAFRAVEERLAANLGR